MIHRGEKGVSEVLEPIRCLDREKAGGGLLSLLKKEAINMEKPLVSFSAAKDCKSLRSFFEEEEE